MSNKLFPVCVVDDFYDNPHDVRELALSQKFYPNEDGRWPGARTKTIDDIDPFLYHYFCKKILSIFYDVEQISGFKIETSFQKIKPHHKEKTNEINRGFIHQDTTLFGGVVYLDTVFEQNSGTSIYTTKNKWWTYNNLDINANNIKMKSYSGNKLSDEDFSMWNLSRDQYLETVKIENIFNRCVLFDGNNHHGVPYFGSDERLTQVFFVTNITFKTVIHPRYPLNKNRV